MHRFRLALCIAALLFAKAGLAQNNDAATARVSTSATEVIRRWFSFIERDQFDSLPQLLAKDFSFQSDGTTWDAQHFVTMIRGLGIHHPTIRLSRVRSTADSGSTTVTYRRLETFRLNGVAHQANESGTLGMVRDNGVWRIRRWSTRDLPP